MKEELACGERQGAGSEGSPVLTPLGSAPLGPLETAPLEWTPGLPGQDQPRGTPLSKGYVEFPEGTSRYLAEEPEKTVAEIK